MVDFDATEYEDADDTDETEEMKTKPEVKIQLLLNKCDGCDYEVQARSKMKKHLGGEHCDDADATEVTDDFKT